MLLNCFVLGTGTGFSIPLSEKVSIKNDDYFIKSLTIDILKEYIWERKNNILKDLTNDASKLELWLVNVEEVVDVFNEDDIVQKLEGNKMKPNFLFSNYFSDQGLTDISRDIANLGYLPRQGGLGGTMLPSDLKVRSTNEGVNINDPDVSLRFDIIPPLIKDLIDKKVILVRAPPFSGKTSVAQILEHTLVNAPEFSNYRVIRISLLWEINFNWDTFGEKWKSGRVLLEKKVDGNNKESADQFWMVVKGLLQEVTRINIIMFAAYGYRSSNHTGLTTPVTLPDPNYKSLIDINFTPSELKKYVEKFSSNYFKNLDQQSVSKLYKYILVVTEGHAGLVRHILTSAENAMKKRIDTSRLTWEEIFKYLNSESFDSSIYNNCRAVPKVSALSNEQISLCEDIYLKGKIRYVDSNEDSVYLVKSGIFIIKNDIDGTYLTFVAPLLKRSFFQQNYGVHNSTDNTPTDLYHFIVKIFTAMCNKLSREILRKTLGFGSDGRILEQTWQKEFYRIGTQVLGKDHFLSCDAGSVFGCDGKIDYYVDKLDWAIELLRDGDDMAEHEERFEPLSGEYKEIVKYAESIAIIDIRSIGRIDTRSEAKKVRKMREHFIYVSCSKGFDAFKIESLGKEIVTINFQD
ncbi:16400_t:CDS:2 [Funneliformis caledonium]|uniref:16400_t:CDS:1 n=1 Tax=Funneliformis caledonium TaxID=1117310 RepID=A0A9N9GTM1_9GLOM|nr:16400_t:CDS:2 [Funneliformis caledonium]